MEMIDRYVYAVTKQLPDNTRKDVERELRSNIEDMLPEHFTEKDVIAVLEKLGNPIKLAEEYGGTKRYLIGPGTYNSYISVLKLVVKIVVSVLLSITALEGIFQHPPNASLVGSIVNIFIKMLGAAMEGGIQAAIWVTVVFVIIDRVDLDKNQLPFSKEKWSPEDLPPVPLKSTKQISKGEVVITMFGAIFLALVLALTPDLIGWYEHQKDTLVMSAPLFDQAVLKNYVPYILLLMFTELLIAVLKFIYGKWNVLLAIFNGVYHALFCIFILVMFNHSELFNDGFKIKLQTFLNLTPSEFASTWLWMIWTVTVTIIVVSIIDTIMGFVKSGKASS